MNRIFILAAIPAFIACGQQETPTTETEQPAAPVTAYFGAKISEEGSVPASTVPAALTTSDSVRMKVVGTIEKVCQVKGCWMTMTVDDSRTMHVSFKDYGFFVPKDIDGKEAVIEGYAHIETMSVEELRHYAEDEGKTPEEIAAITEPETNFSFVADGVIVRDYDVNAPADKDGHEGHDHEAHEHGEGDGHNHDHDEEGHEGHQH
jgi:hypothetical protein